MTERRWRHISTLDQDDPAIEDILVWNSCNGPHYITHSSDEWFGIFHRQGDGWDMWKPVFRPSNDEIITAAKIAKRECMRPVIQPSCGCIFCDLHLQPQTIGVNILVHETKRGNIYCSKSTEAAS